MDNPHYAIAKHLDDYYNKKLPTFPRKRYKEILGTIANVKLSTADNNKIFIIDIAKIKKEWMFIFNNRVVITDSLIDPTYYKVY